jgi:hypothetical protein
MFSMKGIEMSRTQSLIAVAALTLTAGAFAQDVTIERFPTGSLLSRAEVSQQARAALAGGELQLGEDALVSVPAPAVSLPRVAVKGEVLRARAEGELAPVGELLGFESPLAHAQTQRAHPAGARVASR